MLPVVENSVATLHSLFTLPFMEVDFQATAGILEFCRSLLRQSNPSTLTAAGFRPNVILAHPPPPPLCDPVAVADDGDERLNGEYAAAANTGIGLLSFSSLNRASWINGLEALLGGDPQ